MLFDWLVTGQVVAINPAHAVHGPKAPVLTPTEAQKQLDSIDISTLVGLRDRVLIALMAYSFFRLGAAVAMRVALASAKKDFRECASKVRCTQGSKRIVTRNLYEAEREHIHGLKETPTFKRSAHLRKKVEMRFAHLKRNLNPRRLRL